MNFEGWALTYLSGTAVWSVFVACMQVKDSEVHLKDKGDVITAIVICFGWPLIIPAIPIVATAMHLENKLRGRAYKVINENKLTDNKTDRSPYVTVSEKDLKTVLKAFRKKLIELKAGQVEIIREELVNRNMERNLLK